LTLAGQGGKDNHILQIFGRPANSIAAVAMDNNISSDKQAQQALAVAKKRAPKVDPELLFQLRSYVQEAGPTLRNIVEMGPLLKDITEVQQIQNVANTPEPAEDEPQVVQPSKSTQATNVAAPTQTTATTKGVPSGATSIAPMSATINKDPAEEDPMADKELDRVKKNAGISVE
jgi:hypothetical protein